MTSRRLLAAALAALGLGLLAGCQKPLPEVGAFADNEYARATASLWCFEGQAYTAPGACRENPHARTEVKVRPGGPVGVEVPAEVRERGWFVRVVDGKNQVAAGPIQKDKSYFRLSADFARGNTMTVQIVALPQGTNQGETSGVWEFELVNADAS
jgi:hypothetical protein